MPTNSIYFNFIDSISDPLSGSKVSLTPYNPPFATTSSLTSNTPIIEYTNGSGYVEFDNLVQGIYKISYSSAGANNPQNYQKYNDTFFYINTIGLTGSLVNGLSCIITFVSNTNSASLAFTMAASDARYLKISQSVNFASHSLTSDSATSASYALTASYVSGSSISSSYATTSSFALNAGNSLPDITDDTVNHFIGINNPSPSCSLDVNSNIQNSLGTLFIGNTIPRQTIDIAGDVSTIDAIFTGPLNVTGVINAGEITSSLFGSASYATSASYAPSSPSVSASYASTASFALNAGNSYPDITDDTINHFVGINQPSPQSSLDVAGNILLTGYCINSSSVPADTFCVGTNAGESASNAFNSVFIGLRAGRYSTFADSIVCLGRDAGNNAPHADSAVCIGDAAGLNSINSFHANFIGHSAGQDSSTTPYANFIGSEAGSNSSFAWNSNFIGQSVGNTAASASYSNFMGFFTGQNAVLAAYSNFFGYNCGTNANFASESNFIGRAAGQNAISASDSNFIGMSAGANATNAPYSNFIGFFAGRSATNANNSIFIGYNAGRNDTVNNAFTRSSILIGDFTSTGGNSDSICIGKGTKNSTNNQLNIGNVLFALNIGSSSFTSSTPQTNGKVGIGINNPQYTLDVNGTLRIVSSSLLDNGHIATDGQGNIILNQSGAYYPVTMSLDSQGKFQIQYKDAYLKFDRFDEIQLQHPTYGGLYVGSTHNFLGRFDNNAYIGVNQNGTSEWFDNSSTGITLNGSGSVGINQISPAYKLDVNGTIGNSVGNVYLTSASGSVNIQSDQAGVAIYSLADTSITSTAGGVNIIGRYLVSAPITASLRGTASVALNSLFSSASAFSTQSLYATSSLTASYVLHAVSASYAPGSGTSYPDITDDTGNNRIGIVQPSPQYTLDVRGTIGDSVNSANNYIKLDDTGDVGQMTINAAYNVTINGTSAGVTVANWGFNGDTLSDSLGTLTCQTIGVNQPSPTFALDVNGTTGLDNGHITTDGNGNITVNAVGMNYPALLGNPGDGRFQLSHNTQFLSMFDSGFNFGVYNAGAGGTFYSDESGNTSLGRYDSSAQLVLWANGTSDWHDGSGAGIEMDGTGNVGIGINPPLYKLDVNGTVGNSSGDFIIDINSGNEFDVTGNGKTGFRVDPDVALVKMGDVSSTGNGTVFSVIDSSNTFLFEGGKIGIDVTPSVNKLEVNGNISCSVITASLFYGTSSYSKFATTSSVQSSGYTIPIIMAGSSSVSAATSKIVVFTKSMPNSNYSVAITGESAITTPSSAGRTAAGFTASFALYTGNFDWIAVSATQ